MPAAASPARPQATEPALVAFSAYYVATGVLPFVSRRAFEAITGPKREWWLVQTLGALVTVVGGAVGTAALRRRVTPEVRFIAGGSAAALAAIDVVYVARRRISPAYLLDAAVEVALLAGVTSRRPAARRRRPSEPPQPTGGVP